MQGVDAPGPVDGHEGLGARPRVGLGLGERVVIRVHVLEDPPGQVARDGRRDDEVAVRETLHQRAGAEAVRPVVREVGLAEHEESRHRALEVVVHPEAAHRVVHGGVDTHRDLVGVVARDPLVHLEEVPVASFDRRATVPPDGVSEVEVHGLPGGSDAAAVVADGLRVARRHVPRDEVAEARVLALQVVVALRLGDVLRRALVPLRRRHPDAAVVTQRLAHQGELRLVITRAGDARGVDLRVARIGHEGAALVCPPRGGHVGVLGVGREVEDVAVAARAEEHGVGGVALVLTRGQVARDDPARDPVDLDEVDHLAAGVHLDAARLDHAVHRTVSAQEQLLPGLAAGVEGPRHLSAPEGSVVQEAAVLAGEGDALRDALIDDVDGHLRQPVHVGLTAAIVPALHRVVEEAMNAVAITFVVLGRVDAALRSDRVRATRAVMRCRRP